MAYSYLRRLNSDSSLDETLNDIDQNLYIDGGYKGVRSIAIKQNGYISIGGSFKFVDTSFSNIVNLDVNGNLLSNQFNGLVDNCNSLIFHNNNYYFISNFQVIKLDNNFVQDFSFISPYFDGKINTFSFDHNNNIFVGGEFSNGLVRLSSDTGEVDESFSAPITNGYIHIICKAADDKIYIGGDFTQVNSEPYRLLYRLNSDGTMDDTFIPLEATFSSNIMNITLLSNDKLLVSGIFEFSSKQYVMVLNSDGTIDDTFTNPGFNNYVVSDYDNDGNLFVTQFDSQDLRKLDSSLNVDTSFVPQLPNSFYISAIKIQNNGKIIIGGNDLSSPGEHCLIRLNSDGSLDNSYIVHTFPNVMTFDSSNSAISSILEVNDNIVIGGAFKHIDEEERYGFVELDNNGNLINKNNILFTASENTQIVYSIIIDSSQKTLVCGAFNILNYDYIVRLNSDGTIDDTFVNIGINDSIRKIIELSDGKFLIAGGFYQISGDTRRGIARLNSDGTLDTSFATIEGINNLYAMEIQPDGKILIGGDINIFEPDTYTNFIRLNSDGTLDTSFPSINFDNFNIESVHFDNASNKILISGEFLIPSISEDYIGIIRINLDGSIDSTFNTINKRITAISSNL